MKLLLEHGDREFDYKLLQPIPWFKLIDSGYLVRHGVRPNPPITMLKITPAGLEYLKSDAD
jgi:hypothetical protein